GLKTGWRGLKRAVAVRGLNALDGRSAAVRLVREWQAAITADLGGPEQLSAQKRALIDILSRSPLVLNHIDSFMMEQRSLINRKRKAIIPIVRDRQVIVDGIARLVAQIGSDKVEKRVSTFTVPWRQDDRVEKTANGNTAQDSALESKAQDHPSGETER